MTFVDEVNRLTVKFSRNVIGQEDDALEGESEWLMLTHVTVKEVGYRTETGVTRHLPCLQILC